MNFEFYVFRNYPEYLNILRTKQREVENNVALAHLYQEGKSCSQFG